VPFCNRSSTNISHVSGLTFLTFLTSDICGSNILLKIQRLTPSKIGFDLALVEVSAGDNVESL
jgi:hypothetical protein